MSLRDDFPATFIAFPSSFVVVAGLPRIGRNPLLNAVETAVLLVRAPYVDAHGLKPGKFHPNNRPGGPGDVVCNHLIAERFIASPMSRLREDIRSSD